MGMNKNLDFLIERLSSLHRSLLRRAASQYHLQMVHLEILQYLSVCNRYSNTAQALSEYLGQTKGSISQSLKFLEDEGLVQREACITDRRVTRLFITDRARDMLGQVQEAIKNPGVPGQQDDVIASALQAALLAWQKQNHMRGFGLCHSCKHNVRIDSYSFRCGLTGEALNPVETGQICREHEDGEKTAL